MRVELRAICGESGVSWAERIEDLDGASAQAAADERG
jgi:hypothetical protein